VRLAGRTLRIRPGAPAPPALDPVAVVTAFNPASHPTPVADNRAAHRALRARLDAERVRWLPARAHGTGSDSRRWDEPGFALLGEGGAERAVALAAAYDQNAVLVAAGGRPAMLVASRDGFAARRAGDPL
jgi:hypothetical protein